jgi:fructose-specific phosphotransferase system IIC component
MGELIATVVMWLIVDYVVERIMGWLDSWSTDIGGDDDA